MLLSSGTELIPSGSVVGCSGHGASGMFMISIPSYVVSHHFIFHNEIAVLSTLPASLDEPQEEAAENAIE